MPELVIATTNSAKLQQLQDALAPLALHLESLQDYPGSEHIDIVENGKTAKENAWLKATGYTTFLNATVLSMDNALYLDGLPADRQPGLHVRRIYGDGHPAYPTDKTLLDHYSTLIRRLGEQIDGYWEFGICIATVQGQTFETSIRSQRKFVADASPKINTGYPLESLQIDPTTGKYISEMHSQEKATFWQHRIGVPLCAFVQEALAAIHQD